MRTDIDRRILQEARYIAESKDTVRGCGKHFGVSKSTVHKDVTQRLAAINKNLYAQVRDVLEENKAQRHIRGGLATRNKYIREKAADEAQQTP